MAKNTWFKIIPVAPYTWAIDDRGQDVMYLLCGNAKALLIDTGWGVGNLPELVTSLTPLPLTVVNSHMHPDHVAGNGQFSQVYIHKDDLKYIKKPLSKRTRKWAYQALLFPKGSDNLQYVPEGFSAETWASTAAQALPIEEGFVFDLGNRSLEVIHVPGHTRGSICLLDRSNRLLFAGDVVHNGQLWMHLDECVTLAEFLQSLRHLQQWRGEFDAIQWAHSPHPIPASTVESLITATEGIIEGKLSGKPAHTFAGDGLEYKGSGCTILYNPAKIQ